MNLNEMLSQLDALSDVLDGRSRDLSHLGNEIKRLVEGLEALDGGTGNVNTRRALQTLRIASDRCRDATVPVLTARAQSIAYINSVRG